jgi:dipeptidase
MCVAHTCAPQETTSQASRSSMYWDKNAVATLVDVKFSNTQHADNSVCTRTASHRVLISLRGWIQMSWRGAA